MQVGVEWHFPRLWRKIWGPNRHIDRKVRMRVHWVDPCLWSAHDMLSALSLALYWLLCFLPIGDASEVFVLARIRLIVAVDHLVYLPFSQIWQLHHLHLLLRLNMAVSRFWRPWFWGLIRLWTSRRYNWPTWPCLVAANLSWCIYFLDISVNTWPRVGHIVHATSIVWRVHLILLRLLDAWRPAHDSFSALEYLDGELVQIVVDLSHFVQTEVVHRHRLVVEGHLIVQVVNVGFWFHNKRPRDLAAGRVYDVQIVLVVGLNPILVIGVVYDLAAKVATDGGIVFNFDHVALLGWFQHVRVRWCIVHFWTVDFEDLTVDWRHYATHLVASILFEINFGWVLLRALHVALCCLI